MYQDLFMPNYIVKILNENNSCAGTTFVAVPRNLNVISHAPFTPSVVQIIDVFRKQETTSLIDLP
jgi:hypothetical protein